MCHRNQELAMVSSTHYVCHRNRNKCRHWDVSLGPDLPFVNVLDAQLANGTPTRRPCAAIILIRATVFPTMIGPKSSTIASACSGRPQLKLGSCSRLSSVRVLDLRQGTRSTLRYGCGLLAS
ncbi:unnamed protein product [Ostreobium quekettii]|uniref:Uncharacterized protein n=1 Tax=Ostreobium quekettii TaxID=121088 RepID=A0A8S1J932_9CHLO|nr:unnamed protein product [Ostreobium quekettii]